MEVQEFKLDKILLVQIYGLLSEVHGQIGNADESIKYSKKQMALADEIGFVLGKQSAEDNVSVYKAQIDTEALLEKCAKLQKGNFFFVL